MSENTPQDPTDSPADEASKPATAAVDENPLGDLLNRVSARADEKRAEITDQIRAQHEDRARQEREDTERRRRELLKKREKAIKNLDLSTPKGRERATHITRIAKAKKLDAKDAAKGKRQGYKVDKHGRPLKGQRVKTNKAAERAAAKLTVT